MRAPLIAAAMALLPAAALSQDDARALAERGRKLLEEGDFARCAEALEAAQKAQEDPKLYYPLGQCYRALGAWRDAVRAYSLFVQAVEKGRDAADAKKQILALTPFTFEGAAPPREDTFPPLVKHRPPAKTRAGEEFELAAEITDPNAIFSPTLYWRVAGAPEFTPTPLKQKDIQTYAAAVPPQEPGELQYFIEAFDALGNGPARDGTPSYPHTVTVEAMAFTARKPPKPAPAPEPERLWTWVAAGAGAVALLAGTGFGLGSFSILSADKPTTVGGVKRHTITEQQAAAANGLAMGANISFVLAAFGIAGGGVLFFVEPGMGDTGVGGGIAVRGEF
jgi:hypothetical protein